MDGVSALKDGLKHSQMFWGQVLVSQGFIFDIFFGSFHRWNIMTHLESRLPRAFAVAVDEAESKTPLFPGLFG